MMHLIVRRVQWSGLSTFCFRAAFLIGLTTIGLSGCAALSDRRPMPSGNLVDSNAAAALFQKIKLNSTAIGSFRGLFRARIQYKDETNILRYAVLFHYPESIRIEALPTNSTIALSILVGQGGDLVFLDPNSQTAYQAQSTKDTFERVLGLPLSQAGIMRLILGRLTDDTLSHNDYKVFFDTDKQRYFVISSASDTYIEFDSQTLDLLSYQERDRFKDKLTLRIDFADYLVQSGQRFPGIIQVYIPYSSTKIELKPNSLSSNAEINQRLFELKIPQGYRIEQH